VYFKFFHLAKGLKFPDPKVRLILDNHCINKYANYKIVLSNYVNKLIKITIENIVITIVTKFKILHCVKNTIDG